RGAHPGRAQHAVERAASGRARRRRGRLLRLRDHRLRHRLRARPPRARRPPLPGLVERVVRPGISGCDERQAVENVTMTLASISSVPGSIEGPPVAAGAATKPPPVSLPSRTSTTGPTDVPVAA